MVCRVVELNVLLVASPFGVDYDHEVCCPRCWGRRRVRRGRRGRLWVGGRGCRRIGSTTIILPTTSTLQTVEILEVTYPEVVVASLDVLLFRYTGLDDPYDTSVLIWCDGRA